MKQFSLMALALAFSVNASATIICYNQNNKTLVRINQDEQQNSSGIKQVRINVDIVDSGKFDGNLEILGYAHTGENRKMIILAGDPNSGLDLQINSVLAQSDMRNPNDSLMDLSINKKQIKVALTCFQAE